MRWWKANLSCFYSDRVRKTGVAPGDRPRGPEREATRGSSQALRPAPRAPPTARGGQWPWARLQLSPCLVLTTAQVVDSWGLPATRVSGSTPFANAHFTQHTVYTYILKYFINTKESKKVGTEEQQRNKKKEANGKQIATWQTRVRADSDIECRTTTHSHPGPRFSDKKRDPGSAVYSRLTLNSDTKMDGEQKDEKRCKKDVKNAEVLIIMSVKIDAITRGLTRGKGDFSSLLKGHHSRKIGLSEVSVCITADLQIIRMKT